MKPVHVACVAMSFCFRSLSTFSPSPISSLDAVMIKTLMLDTSGKLCKSRSGTHAFRSLGRGNEPSEGDGSRVPITTQGATALHADRNESSEVLTSSHATSTVSEADAEDSVADSFGRQNDRQERKSMPVAVIRDWHMS